MKKTMILSCFLCMISLCAMAQLSIDSLNTIRTNPPFYIKGKSTETYSANVYGSKHGFMVLNNGGGVTTNDGQVRYGMYVANQLANNITNMGIFVYPQANTTTNSNEYGILSGAGNSSHGSYGIYGGFYKPLEVTNGAGVYGSSNPIWIIPPTFSGVYAAFFNGNVRVINGSVTANVITPSAAMSMRGQGEVKDVQVVTPNVADKLRGVQLLVMTRVNEDVLEKSPSLSIDVEDGENAMEVLSEQKMRPSTLAKTGYSLDAAQLREIFPELVYEDKNGNIGINYVEMVPLLVQAINELRAEVEALKESNKK